MQSIETNEEHPCFLDFEASSLGLDSYPIQVAWSLPDGQVESLFINPAPIEHWTDWNFHAERDIHKISLKLLSDVGQHPKKVAQALNNALSGRPVFVDGLPYDQMWLEALFDEADCAPDFYLEQFETLIWDTLPESLIPQSRSARHKTWQQMSGQARQRCNVRAHLADNDVRYLQAFYQVALEQRGAIPSV